MSNSPSDDEYQDSHNGCSNISLLGSEVQKRIGTIIIIYLVYVNVRILLIIL